MVSKEGIIMAKDEADKRRKRRNRQQAEATKAIVDLATIGARIKAVEAEMKQEAEDAEVTLGFKRSALANNVAETKKTINGMFGPASGQSKATKDFIGKVDEKLVGYL